MRKNKKAQFIYMWFPVLIVRDGGVWRVCVSWKASAITIYRALELGEEDAGQTAPFPASVLGIYSCHGAEPGWEEGEEVTMAVFGMGLNGVIFFIMVLLYGLECWGLGG